MPICIECSYPVSHLYSTYSRADDQSLGKGVRLTQCPRCKRFADKYVEYDFVVLFIDLFLIKPQVYRHLLFNRLEGEEHKFDRSIIRLGVLLLLFDVYLTWARIEKSLSLDTTFLSRAPIVVQYLFFLSLNALATLAHHLTVRLLASILAPNSATRNDTNSSPSQPTDTPVPNNPSTPVIPTFPQAQSMSPGTVSSPPNLTSRKSSQDTSISNPPTNESQQNQQTTHHPLPSSPRGSISTLQPLLRRTSTAPLQPISPPAPASPTAISTALFVSSCAKLFPILLVIWGPDGSGSSRTSATPSAGTNAVAQPNIAQQALRGITSATTSSGSATRSGARVGTSFSSSAVSTPLLENLARVMPEAIPTSYVAYFAELVGPLFTLEAADTHLVLLSNIEALYILLGCGYFRAMALAVAGLTARWAVQRVILGAVGVG